MFHCLFLFKFQYCVYVCVCVALRVEWQNSTPRLARRSTPERRNGNIILSEYFISSSGDRTHNHSVYSHTLSPCATIGLIIMNNHELLFINIYIFYKKEGARKFVGKRITECLSTRFPLPTLLYTGYSVNLKKKTKITFS